MISFLHLSFHLEHILWILLEEALSKVYDIRRFVSDDIKSMFNVHLLHYTMDNWNGRVATTSVAVSLLIPLEINL